LLLVSLLVGLYIIEGL
jgi:hypothetical protein